MRHALSGIALDGRLAIRRLRHSLGYSISAILLLTLGIGATTALFSAVRGVLLRPLPFPEPDRLVRLCEVHPSVQGFCIASPYSVREWARQSRTLKAVGLARDWSYSMRRDRGARESVAAGWATPGLFTALAITPAIGRLFREEDVGPGANRTVVLTDAFWRTEFAADPGVVGRRLELDGQSHEVLGVLRPGDRVPGLASPKFWVPLPIDAAEESNRRWRGFEVIGRMAKGAEVGAVRAELGRLELELGTALPESHAGWRVTAAALREDVVGGVRGRLLTFAGATIVLLLIACANVAGLMIARGTARERELAVCAALGSGRSRLVRVVLVESLLLGIAGGILGLWLGAMGTSLFVALAPRGIPRLDEIRLDSTVLAFTLVTTLATVMLFGLFPAFRAGAVAPAGLVTTGVRVTSRGGPFRRTLIAIEVGLACLLLVGAALVLRSYSALLGWSPGLDRDEVTVTWTSLSNERYRDGQSAATAYQRVLESTRQIPGITAAGLVSGGPLFGGRELGQFGPAAGVAEPERSVTTARWFDASPGYFAALGLQLRAGRDFSPDDGFGAARVAVVNEAFARRVWPGVAPIGQEVVRRDDGAHLRVVGVVADVPPLDPDASSEPEIYWPNQQEPRWGAFLVLRSSGERTTLPVAVRERLSVIEPELTTGAFTTLEERFERELVSPRFNVLLLGTFGGVAFGLALAGIYGLMSYTVAIGARETAIRLALGASPRRLLRWVVAGGMRPVLVGLAVGLASAAGLSRLMVSLLEGVAPTDPVTYIAVGVVVAGMALVAAWLPARRVRQGSIELLRTE
jgi:predicted permease